MEETIDIIYWRNSYTLPQIITPKTLENINYWGWFKVLVLEGEV